MKGHDVGATVAFADYTRDVDALRKQLADAQATVEALQKKYDDLLGKYHQLVDFYDKHNGTPCEQIRHQQQVEALQAQLESANTLLHKKNCAIGKAETTIEALQRERGEAASDRDDWITSWRALQRYNERIEAALDAEREKVKGLHEITKVICTHCCEPMEIPSKAVLQTQLTQLQALVRALPVFTDISVRYTKDENDFEAWNVRADHGPFAECETEAAAQGLMAILKYRATLDATTPAPDTSIVGKCEPPSQWYPNAQVRGDIS